MAAFDHAMKQHGTNYDWTPTLPQRIADLGLANIGATGEAAWFEGASDLARFWASNLSELHSEMINLGVIDERIYREAIEVLLTPGRWLPSILVLAAWGQAP